MCRYFIKPFPTLVNISCILLPIYWWVFAPDWRLFVLEFRCLMLTRWENHLLTFIVRLTFIPKKERALLIWTLCSWFINSFKDDLTRFGPSKLKMTKRQKVKIKAKWMCIVQRSILGIFSAIFWSFSNIAWHCYDIVDTFYFQAFRCWYPTRIISAGFGSYLKSIPLSVARTEMHEKRMTSYPWKNVLHCDTNDTKYVKSYRLGHI